MTYRVFATRDIGAEALQRLRDAGFELEVHAGAEPPSREAILEKLRSGIHALITTLRDPIDAEVLAAGAAHGLRVVSQMAVGVDNIDRAAANRHHIPVTHTPDVLTEATAEYAFFLMGAVARRTWPAEQMVRERTWSTWHPYLPWLGEGVAGRVLAVVGTGRIGRSLVRKAVGFDMDVICAGRRPDAAFLDAVRRVMEVRHEAGLSPRRQSVEWRPLDEALPAADFVSLHVPLTRPGQSEEPTLGLMDERRLKLMKPTAFLVNTSRGPVVDEAALVRALREGWIAGAALDVFDVEPLPADSPLRDPGLALKLRLLPHHGSATRATRLSPDPEVGMAGRCVQGVIDVLEGRHGGDPRRMPYVLNKEAF
jgi:glyoxylate reductase